MNESISECVEFGGVRAHTWSYDCDTWYEEIEDPTPAHPLMPMWSSCVDPGLRTRMNFSGCWEWYRVTQRWHFGKVEQCVWCKQFRKQEMWNGPQEYNFAMSERRRMQDSAPYRQ